MAIADFLAPSRLDLQGVIDVQEDRIDRMKRLHPRFHWIWVH